MENNFTITSEKGFYLGDPCYVLKEEDYDKVVESHEPDTNAYSVEIRGYTMALGFTAVSDGVFAGLPVDSGTIAVVPLELIENLSDDLQMCGYVCTKNGTVDFYYDDGYFDVTFPDGTCYTINTESGDDEEEDDE